MKNSSSFLDFEYKWSYRDWIFYNEKINKFIHVKSQFPSEQPKFDITFNESPLKGCS